MHLCVAQLAHLVSALRYKFITPLQTALGGIVFVGTEYKLFDSYRQLASRWKLLERFTNYQPSYKFFTTFIHDTTKCN
jgi:hypothetical protein